ncbi:MFS transporter [Streptomyces sp. NBC_00237]|uniref:MFS transporter n=1 Tax=Streptomyces sp. NBC_00237 TaxID=2975687 RepID=UPI0022521621|nr:MFS transporter [Streptomyces sp. NBC_00237]MCX5207269.1 MFS transporter [Streptomyces sp. NBC_00237]
MHSPWRNPDFRRLFAAAAISQTGTQVGYVAIPLVAVVALDAGPGQAGVLATLSTVAFLLIGLPAGAWVDRLRHRSLMVTADLVRAGTLLTVPLAWAADLLTLWQLYAVVLVNGCATVFFDVASQSVLPRVVGREGLLDANAAMTSLQAAGNAGGRAVGGGLVQLAGAPVAVAVNAVSHLASALFLRGTRMSDAPPKRGQTRPRVCEGLRHVLGTPGLRPLVLGGTFINFGNQMINTVLPVIFVDELGLTASALGLYWAAGGVGIFVGSRLARPVSRRFGIGRTLGAAGLVVAPAGLLVPLLDRGPWLWIAGIGWVLTCVKVGLDNVLGVSLRQRLTPEHLLGRMNATFRFMLMGALALGSAAAGLIGELAGARAAMWVGAGFLAIVWVPAVLSPLRSLRDLPEEIHAGPDGTSRTPAGAGAGTEAGAGAGTRAGRGPVPGAPDAGPGPRVAS